MLYQAAAAFKSVIKSTDKISCLIGGSTLWFLKVNNMKEKLNFVKKHVDTFGFRPKKWLPIKR
jgi:hypothetical protein